MTDDKEGDNSGAVLLCGCSVVFHDDWWRAVQGNFFLGSSLLGAEIVISMPLSPRAPGNTAMARFEMRRRCIHGDCWPAQLDKHLLEVHFCQHVPCHPDPPDNVAAHNNLKGNGSKLILLACRAGQASAGGGDRDQHALSPGVPHQGAPGQGREAAAGAHSRCLALATLLACSAASSTLKKPQLAYALLVSWPLYACVHASTD